MSNTTRTYEVSYSGISLPSAIVWPLQDAVFTDDSYAQVSGHAIRTRSESAAHRYYNALRAAGANATLTESTTSGVHR